MSEYKKQYPWLRMYDPDPADVDNDDFDALDCLPTGWVKAFGELLCEDLDRAIKAENLQDEFRILEAKEKWGQFRLYCHPCTHAIQDILRKYEAISEVVCSICGSIEGVKRVTWGWTCPYCKSCFDKVERGRNLDKFDNLPTNELPTIIKWSRFGKECGHEDFEMDVSDTIEKIRKRYAERKANGEFKDDIFAEWEDNYYGA